MAYVFGTAVPLITLRPEHFVNGPLRGILDGYRQANADGKVFLIGPTDGIVLAVFDPSVKGGEIYYTHPHLSAILPHFDNFNEPDVELVLDGNVVRIQKATGASWKFVDRSWTTFVLSVPPVAAPSEAAAF